MEELHDRINRVINTSEFEAALRVYGVDLIDFQCDWAASGGVFEELPHSYKEAILAGEKALSATGELVIA